MINLNDGGWDYGHGSASGGGLPTGYGGGHGRHAPAAGGGYRNGIGYGHGRGAGPGDYRGRGVAAAGGVVERRDGSGWSANPEGDVTGCGMGDGSAPEAGSLDGSGVGQYPN